MSVAGEILPLALGGCTFEVPRLPLGATIIAYPACQRLSNAGLPERIERSGEMPLELTEAEMRDLVEVAFQAAHAADEAIDTQAFLAMSVTPPELFAAFFLVRLQCGGWRKTTGEGGDRPGEPIGA